METIDRSWDKFADGKFTLATDMLFGDDFMTSLTVRVEKDNAFSKAVSITRRYKKQGELRLPPEILRSPSEKE